MKRNVSKRTSVLVCIFIASWSFVHVALYSRISDTTTTVASTSNYAPSPPFVGATPVYGTYTKLVSNTTEVVYALPDNDNKRKPIKGISLLLHACTHDALKFFSPCSTCPRCIGLSEELRIARILLRRNYAVVAITSQDRQSKCWSDRDLTKARSVLHEFQSMMLGQATITTTNIIAVGASSGGKFAAQLAADGVVHAALIMVMSLGRTLQTKLVQLNVSSNARPLLYLAPMPRDTQTTAAARFDFQALKRANYSSMSIVFDDSTCVALPVTPDYLYQRVPGMSVEMANTIVDKLVATHHLDPTTLMLRMDPTRSDWRHVLQDCVGNHHSLQAGKSPLAKALHRAWAFHEYCSEVVDKALDFFEERSGHIMSE